MHSLRCPQNYEQTLQGIEPLLDGEVEAFLDVEKVRSYFHLKRRLLGTKIRNPSIKDWSISFIPNTPSTYHKNFHEEWLS